MGQRPESFGSDIEHLVQVLHDHCGAEFIMVCLVIYRSAIPPHVSDFSHKVDLLNKYLKVVLEPLPYTEAWSHRGLQSPSIAILFWDGIHLNEVGDYALYRSYGGAILFALKKLATFSEAQWQIPTCLSSHAFYFHCNRPLSRTGEFYLKRKAVRQGGSLWGSLIDLGSKLLPMAMPLAKEAIASLATGALSG